VTVPFETNVTSLRVRVRRRSARSWPMPAPRRRRPTRRGPASTGISAIWKCLPPSTRMPERGRASSGTAGRPRLSDTPRRSRLASATTLPFASNTTKRSACVMALKSAATPSAVALTSGSAAEPGSVRMEKNFGSCTITCPAIASSSARAPIMSSKIDAARIRSSRTFRSACSVMLWFTVQRTADVSASRGRTVAKRIFQWSRTPFMTRGRARCRGFRPRRP
jgi:hypothetical protein